MPSIVHERAKIDFFGMTNRELVELVKQWGWPAFRADQVTDWVHRKMVLDPLAMSNLSKADRATLAEKFSFGTSTITRQQNSNDGTIKLLLTWPDGATAETVMIPDADRRTACVSSQVGCPAGCKFCASGIGGVKGNLTAGQIVEQVMRLNEVMNTGTKAQRHEGTKGKEGGKAGTEARRHRGTKGEDAEKNRTSEDAVESAPHSSSPSCLRASVPPCLSSSLSVTNIVFMGMGEPLANYANVMSAVRILHDPKGLNIGARRITVSTVGVPSKMKQLAGEDLPLNLAISLHAPNESLRRQLIPWAEHFTMDEILDAARFYFDQTGREITLEYILLSGVNDQPQHAAELAKVCHTLRANVNLIRYNEVSELPFKRPDSHDVMNFQAILRNNGVNAHVRKSRGRDIDAACGQLRRKAEEQTQTVQISVP